MTYRLGTVVTVVAFVASFSVPASAQVTGSVAGAVRDAQGGVIPGATVTLVSETRGVKLPSAVTSVNGDFVFVNVTADTYTLEVTMSGFKTAQRKGVAVSPADRVAIPTITLEIGGVTETVDVKGDTPLIQAYTGERSFTVATDSVANLPLADRNFATLATLAPGVDGTARVGGGGATNFMMDGASTMDTGSNRLLVAVNVESIAEVKVLASGYQAEYGSIERASDHGRDARRHESVPRLRLRRRTQLRLELEHQDEQAQRRSQGDHEAARVGLFDWRTGREARRQKQAVLFLQP